MKKIGLVIVVALLVTMVGIAQASVSTNIQVDNSLTFLFNGELHNLTNPATVSLVGSGTVNDVIMVFAVPGDSDTLATKLGVNGGSLNISGSQSGLLNGGDLTTGLNVYDNIIGIGGNNSESFANFTLNPPDKSVTSFDIWLFDLGTSLTSATPISVAFGPTAPVGTYAFAYGYGKDNAGKSKLYVTAFTQTGLQQGPPKVPEPSTMLLLGSGLLGLAIFGRKKF